MATEHFWGCLAAPQVVLFARVATGLLLISAGTAKLPYLRGFQTILTSFGLMPRGLAVILGPLLPIIEILIGSHLLIARSTYWSALACLVLFLLFGIGITINLIRKRDISCGCFGMEVRTSLSWSLVARNIAFTNLSLIVFISSNPPKSHESLQLNAFMDSILSGLGVVAMVWLWDAIGSLASVNKRPSGADL